MDRIEQSLRQLSADLPPVPAGAATETLPTVLRRGRLYQAGFSALVGLGASTLVLGAVVAVPRILDPSPAPPPVLVDTTEDLDATDLVEIDDKPDDVAADEPVTKDVDAAEKPEAPDKEPTPAVEKEPAPAPTTKPAADGDGGTKTPAEPAPKPTVGDEGKHPDKGDTKADTTLTASQEHAALHGEPYANRYWGTAAPGAKVKVFSDYGWAEAVADAGGHWTTTVTFTPPAGTTTFTVTAKLSSHPDVAKSFSLKTTREGVAFTAHQKHDEVSSPHANDYWGTATPGDTVVVWAGEHGEASTVAAGDGTWAVTLHLKNVGPGDTVKVKARNMSTGEHVWFTVGIT